MNIKIGQTITTAIFRDLSEEDLEHAAEAGLAFVADYRNVERMTIHNPPEFFVGLGLSADETKAYPILGLSRDRTLLVMQSCYGWGKEDQIHCTAVRVVGPL